MTTVWVTLSAIGGTVLGFGLWLLLRAAGDLNLLRGTPERRPALTRTRLLRLAGALTAGAAAFAATGWIAAAVLAAAGVWWLPSLLGPDREHEHQVERVLAVATWAESLHDLMAGASGIHQAIAATTADAPEAIRADVAHLDEQLRLGMAPEVALREFAARVDAPTADLVVAALTTAITRQAGSLGELLASLSTAARDQANMLEAVAATRKRTRTAARMITGTSLGLALFLLAFNRDFFTPYDTSTGQLVLVGIGALWGVGLVWLARMSRVSLGPRILAHQPPETRVGQEAHT